MARSLIPPPPASLAARVPGYLGTARLAFSAGFWEQTTSNAYYACLHAARALLATAGIAADTHKGTQEMLSLHFVRAGALPRSTGRDLNRLLGDRELADYGIAGDIDADAAREAIRLAAGVLRPVLALLPVRDPACAEAASSALEALAALEAQTA